MISNLEEFFIERNIKGTQLIRGGNWLDNYFNTTVGINARCTNEPEKAFSTVGFRYVIKIEPPKQ